MKDLFSKLSSNKKLISGLMIIAIIIFLYWAFTIGGNKKTNNQPKPTPTFTPERQATWNSLTPGRSTLKETEEKLGLPIDESVSDGIARATYKSKSPTRNHEAQYSNGVLVYLKEVVTLKDETKVKDIEKEYGKAPLVLYGPDSNSGINLYAYPEYGMAYLGNPIDNTIMEIWYFPATTEKDFINSYAKGYFNTPQPQF